MKIKDVIEKTDLTDRAIRLYIENGLVSPSYNESYAGRKNIDFSEGDVESLKNIATLRKAGFSIAEIKLLKLGDVPRRKTLEEFIEKTTQRIESDKAVIEKLEAVVTAEDLTMETICESLNAVTEEKDIPAEDTQISMITKITRMVFLIVGSLSFLVGILLALQIYHYEIKGWMHYLYPTYTFPEWLILLWPLVPLVLSLYLIFAYHKIPFLTKKRKIIKTVISVALAALLVWFTVYDSLYVWILSLDDYPGVVISETDDFENYMSFDSEQAEITLAEFLPKEVSITDVKAYKYSYQEYGVSHEPPDTTVFLELELNEKEFNEIVEKYKAFRPADSTCEPDEFNSTYWTIIFYRENDERSPSNYAPVFAYDKYINRVRFICEYGRISSKGYSKDFPDICYW